MLSFPIGSFSFRKHGTGRQPWGGHYIREAGLVGLVRAIGVGVRFSLLLEASWSRQITGSHEGSRAKAMTDEWVLCRPPATMFFLCQAKSSIVGSAPTVVR